MTWWIWLLPLMGAFLGWAATKLALLALFHPVHAKKIAGLSIQGFIPKRQEEIAKKIGAMAASLLPPSEIAEKITQPDNVKKIMPLAEEHIDHFLRVKLVKSMPVVGMFVGDKTIDSLKSLFMTELEALFPVIMDRYIGNLQEEFDVETMVSSRLVAIPAIAIEKAFRENTWKEQRMLGLVGGLTGFVIGLLQLGIAHFAFHQ